MSPLISRRLIGPCLPAALALLYAAGAPAQMAGGLDLPAERARIRAEQDRIVRTRTQEELECQTRFVVTGCVEDVRQRWLAPLAELDRQERVLNDLDRRQRSSEQVLRLERKASEAEADAAERRAKAASEQQSREARAAAKASGPRPAGTPRQDRSSAVASGASAPRDTVPRARPQQPRPAASPGSKAAAPSGVSPEQARANASAHAERVRQAQAHKAEVLQRQASRSKPPASDLPPPR